MTEIFCVEDDAQIAQILREYLGERGCRAQCFGRLAQARQALSVHLPSLLLLDRNMPDGQGADFCRWLRGRWPGLPVIFLTVQGEPAEVVEGLGCGADDYIAKPFELDVLYARIQALLRRAEGPGQGRLCCGSLALDTQRKTACAEGRELALTQTEYRLLEALLREKGRTVTRTFLLEQVWDAAENYVNDNTLTVAMKRLRQKLGSPACLKTVRSFGYRMEEP